MEISVFITSYNQKIYLIDAIESVLDQSLRPFEIIIVDDCSQDGSQAVIAGYASRYPDLVKPIYHNQNQGIAQTRIDALKAVLGEYVTYVDGDDRVLPNKLETETRILRENSSIQLVYSNYFYIDKNGGLIGVWANEENPPQGNVFHYVFSRNFPRGSLFRNELVNYRAYRNIGLPDPNLSIFEDFEMRIRLTKELEVAYCNEPLAEYRVHDNGLSREKAAEKLSSFEYIYQKNKHLLNDLPSETQREVKYRFYEFCARFARQASKEAKDNGMKSERIRYYFGFLSYFARAVLYQKMKGGSRRTEVLESTAA
jgi:glycosyltransferase involved in cell wall biosynthesis